MIKYKKGNVILAIYGTAHTTLIKFLADTDAAGQWNNYIAMQINRNSKTISWPHKIVDRRFKPHENFKFVTDIESIVNFKKDYIKAVLESGYKLK